MNSFFTGIRETVAPPPGARHGPLPPLLLGLTLVTGLVDAFSYLVLGHVFVANMTGNVVFLGFALVGAPGFSIGASAVALVGYSLMEFMLGVDAPVSLELLRQIVFGILLNTIVALPMWALTRRALEGALPEDPRRRRSRRAYTTGGLSPLTKRT